MASAPQKIAIVTTSLAHGGAERVAANLSSGQLYNLGLEVKQQGWMRKWIKAIRLKRYLQAQHISAVIDNRTRPVFSKEVVYKWVYSQRHVIWMVHSFKLENYLPKSKWLTQLIYPKSTPFVAVSQAISERIKTKYGFECVHTIYNSIPSFPEFNSIQDKEKASYILFAGRLDNSVKNFSLLLEGYALSGLSQVGVELKIMGDGPDVTFILEQIQQLQLTGSVEVLPFQANPFEVIQQAKFTVLSSHYEGFPMAVVESLALGVPVVSVDCPSGPAELIQSGQNGILVPNYNVQALADAMRELYANTALYENCKNKAQKSVEHLSLAAISSCWNNLLQTSYDKHD
jgi:glycosyltransferase involved in cell wall biosynthesis